RGRAGAGPCARRCRAPRWGRSRRRGARARAAPGWRSHLGSTPSRAQLYGVRPARPGGVVSSAAAAVTVGAEKRPEVDRLVLPNYDGPCITNVVPSLLSTPDEAPDWLPQPAVGARQVVLFVVDGLGREQLQARLSLT